MSRMSGKYEALTFILGFFLVVATEVYAQEKANMHLGLGFAEAAHVGFRTDVHNQLQLGMSIGTWPSPNDWLFDWKLLLSISGDCYIHFGDTTVYSMLRPWYIRTGLDYYYISWDDEESPTDNDLEYHLRIGRDFYFSQNSGISLDAGMALFLLNETGFTTLLPAMGISLFYRF